MCALEFHIINKSETRKHASTIVSHPVSSVEMRQRIYIIVVISLVVWTLASPTQIIQGLVRENPQHASINQCTQPLGEKARQLDMLSGEDIIQGGKFDVEKAKEAIGKKNVGIIHDLYPPSAKIIK